MMADFVNWKVGASTGCSSSGGQTGRMLNSGHSYLFFFFFFLQRKGCKLKKCRLKCAKCYWKSRKKSIVWMKRVVVEFMFDTRLALRGKLRHL